MEITNTSERKQQKFNAVVLGWVGSGKTNLCATLPDLTKTLFVNVKRYEDGFKVLEDHKIDMIHIATFEDLVSLPEMLKSKEVNKYSYIYFDGISAASKVSLKHFEEITKKSSNHFEKYRLHGEFMTELMLDLKGVNKHIIMTALPDVKKGREGQEIYSFYVDGNMFSKSLEQTVDAILVIGSDAEGKRKLLTQNNGSWVAKLRHPRSIQIDTFIEVDLDKKETGLSTILNKLGYSD